MMASGKQENDAITEVLHWMDAQIHVKSAYFILAFSLLELILRIHQFVTNVETGSKNLLKNVTMETITMTFASGIAPEPMERFARKIQTYFQHANVIMQLDTMMTELNLTLASLINASSMVQVQENVGRTKCQMLMFLDVFMKLELTIVSVLILINGSQMTLKTEDANVFILPQIGGL